MLFRRKIARLARRVSNVRLSTFWTLVQIAAALASAMFATRAMAEEACSVRSAAQSAPVVELYTSEGCNSCPPADRWMSKLKADPSVVALAFHVDYWDRLGWTDRFASARYTERQSQTQASSGARFSYTPQVLVDGADRHDWSRIPGFAAAREPASPVDVRLMREGNRYVATIRPVTGANSGPNASPARLSAYWAVTENDHVSAVKAGENEGVTLHHDFVVREYSPVAAWSADTPSVLRFEPSIPRDAAHPPTVNLVVVDAAKGRPVQAVKLGC